MKRTVVRIQLVLVQSGALILKRRDNIMRYYTKEILLQAVREQTAKTTLRSLQDK